MREELAPDGIRVTTVFPGPTDTQMLTEHSEHWENLPKNRPEAVAELIWEAWGVEHAPAEIEARAQ